MLARAQVLNYVGIPFAKQTMWRKAIEKGTLDSCREVHEDLVSRSLLTHSCPSDRHWLVLLHFYPAQTLPSCPTRQMHGTQPHPHYDCCWQAAALHHPSSTKLSKETGRSWHTF